MFVKLVERLLKKLPIDERDFLFQFVVYNSECPESFYDSYTNIPKIIPLDNVNNNLLDITKKDITIIKKAIKSSDGIKLKYYASNYIFFSKIENKNAFIKIATREEEDIFVYL